MMNKATPWIAGIVSLFLGSISMGLGIDLHLAVLGVPGVVGIIIGCFILFFATMP